MSFGTDGFMVNASASGAKAKADGADTSYTDTQIKAGNKAGESVTLKSGGDTTLKGAVIAANTVKADIGGNLHIESLQDKSVYASKQASVGGSLTVGAGVSGSVSASKSKVNSSFESVTEQSGIKTGDGGFQVDVKGNTDLKGAVIASTDRAVEEGRNAFTTGTLTTSDIQNKADASAKSSGIALSSDMAGQGKYGAAKAIVGTALGSSKESGSSAGQTRSAVSGATVTITDEAGQQAKTGKSAEETVASLNRETAGAHTAAQKQDVQAMVRTVEAERVIKEAAFKMVTQLVTDAVYRSDTGAQKIIVEKCVPGGSCTKTEVNLESHTLLHGTDGKLYVFNHGIQNSEAQALENAAQQHPDQAQTGIYTVINPHTGNAVAEVVYAGLDKLREVTGLFGMSNAATANIDLRNLVEQQNREAASNGGQLLQIDEANHSRGTLTSSIATQGQVNAGQSGVPLGTVIFYGGAANARRMADRVEAATGGAGQVQQSTHINDAVGTLIGGNAPTGGLPSSFGAAHTTYGPNVPTDRSDLVWGPDIQSPSVPVRPQP